jgi:PAS domain S-box-containing protein
VACVPPHRIANYYDAGMTNRLRHDEVLVSAFMASITDHVYFKDRESRFLSVSNSIAQVFGCRIEDVLGKTDYDFYDEIHARSYQETELQVMNTGQSLIDHEVKLILPDGREVWILKVIVPMRDRCGDIVGVFGTCKDITAAKAMEQELAKANEQLRHLSRSAGMAEIANNVLHNIGNVLNSATVSAGLIGTRVRESKGSGLAKAVQLINDHPEDLGEFLTHTDKGKALPGYLNKLVAALATERRSIVEELETLTKSIEHIKEVVTAQQAYAGTSSVIEPVQVRELMEDALRMNAASIQRLEISVIRDFVDVPPLLLDKHLVLQILVNLISNAKHAMDGVPERAHQMTLRIGIEKFTGGSCVAIRVEDDGEGIAPEVLPRLFAHGFTTRRNGHGFGLHSCALAAKEMGGSIEAHSEGPGRGSVFTLKLPMKRPRASR